ncbi:hypothetical protein NC652_006738 [Populus alba x Populus x berolinensis]|nr:hypothetical protein NC652_006738 [Populus alba x Populus x berolinensis]
MISTSLRKLVKLEAGSIEGQVVEMGLTTTSLLDVEQFPVLVPNSLFSSQSKDVYNTEEDILLQSVRIIKERGAKLSSTWQDSTGQ